MPKISVLIPAYNVEKYVARCLDSVIAQTFSDIEIIIVNDGSTDGTAAIIDDYSVRDSRIKVVNHPENCGLMWGRKTCVEASTGDFLMFVDSDDAVTPYACEKLYSKAVKTGADIVVAGHDLVDMNGAVSQWDNKLCHGDSSYGFAMAMAMDEMDRYLWGKLYKRGLFLDNPVKYFMHLNIGEDQIISYQVARYVKKVVTIPDSVYQYYRNSSSLLYNIYAFRSEKNLRDFLTASKLTVELSGQIDSRIKIITETNAMRCFFNWIKRGFARQKIMGLVDEYGFSDLFTVPSLIRHLGFRKALVYYPVTRFDAASRIIYGNKGSI